MSNLKQEIKQKIIARISELEELLMRIRGQISYETNYRRKKKLEQDEQDTIIEIDRLKKDFLEIDKEEIANTDNLFKQFVLLYITACFGLIIGILTFNFGGLLIIFLSIALIIIENYNSKKKVSFLSYFIIGSYILLISFIINIYLKTESFELISNSFNLNNSLTDDESINVAPIITKEIFTKLIKLINAITVFFSILKIFMTIKKKSNAR